jgi:limonene-1,2-epoxide hydrolase
MPKREEEIVRSFLGAFHHSWPADMEAALAPLAEDASYQIVVPTIPPIHGRPQILASLRRMQLTVEDQKHEILAIGSGGSLVFTERVDQSKRNGHWTRIPVVGVFEVDDRGRITAWREYLDLANTARQHGIAVETLLQSIELRDG